MDDKNILIGELSEAVPTLHSVAGMLPFWWPIYRTLRVLGLTGWQACLMFHWVPIYEERRFTEQKCLTAIKAAKDRGMEITAADIENRTPFSGILDPDGSKRKAWAEDFAHRHPWATVMVYGSEKLVRIRKGDDDWQDLYQHSWDATTAYLDEVKPEIPYGTQYTSLVLLRDTLSTPTNKIIPQQMQQRAFQQAKNLHRLRNKQFPGKQKFTEKRLRFACVIALLMVLNFKIIFPSSPIRTLPLPHPRSHRLVWSDSSLHAGVSLAEESRKDSTYAAVYLKQILPLAEKTTYVEEQVEVRAAIARVAWELEDMPQGNTLLEQTLATAKKIDEEEWRSSMLASVVQGAGELKETAQSKALLVQALAAAEKISFEHGRSTVLYSIALGAGKLKDTTQANALLKQTLAAAQRISNELARENALEGIAQGAGELKDSAQATALLEQTLTVAENIKEENWRASLLASVAQGMGELKDNIQGKALLKKVQTDLKKLSDEHDRDIVLTGVAQGQAALDAQAQSATLLEQTLTATKKIRDEASRAEALAGVAMRAGELRDTTQAFALLERTAAAAKKIEDALFIKPLDGVAAGYAELGNQAPSAAALDKILAAADHLNEQNRAAALFGIGCRAGRLKDTERGKALLEKVLTATENITDERYRATALAGVAQGAQALRDTAKAMSVLDQTLISAEKISDEFIRAHALTEVFANIPITLLLRQMEENRDPKFRCRIATDIHNILWRGGDTWSGASVPFGTSTGLVREHGLNALCRNALIHQITPSVNRELCDENEEVRLTMRSLAEEARIPLPEDVNIAAEHEMSFTEFLPVAIYALLLLLPEGTAFLLLNAAGEAFAQEERSQSAKFLKIADSNILLRAAGYNDRAIRELLLAISITPEDLQRVMPERLAQVLDIPLQGLLVAACASPEAAIPILTALDNRWEALHPPIREDDVRRQANFLAAMLQAMLQGGNMALQADARRCLTRLQHFMGIPMKEPLHQDNADSTQRLMSFRTLMDRADGSIKTEAPEPRNLTSHQGVQEQYDSQKRADEINHLS